MKQKRVPLKRKCRRSRQDEEHHGTVAVQQPSAQSDVTALQSQIEDAAVQRLEVKVNTLMSKGVLP